MTISSATTDETVIIVSTGVANLASVRSAFAKLGYRTECSADSETIIKAAFVVLPGVGAFEAGMRTLRENRLGQALISRIMADRPTLAVCLGMQLLAFTSEESPGVEGLGVVPGNITRFSRATRVPQMGWNRVEGSPHSRYLRSGYAYFANSFYLKEPPQGWIPALSSYEEPFVSAIERGRCLACQFHPELSGAWGMNLLNAWLLNRSSQESS